MNNVDIIVRLDAILAAIQANTGAIVALTARVAALEEA